MLRLANLKSQVSPLKSPSTMLSSSSLWLAHNRSNMCTPRALLPGGLRGTQHSSLQLLILGSTVRHHCTVIPICKYQQCATKTHSSFRCCWASSCWYRIWIISRETSRPDLRNSSAADFHLTNNNAPLHNSPECHVSQSCLRCVCVCVTGLASTWPEIWPCQP